MRKGLFSILVLGFLGSVPLLADTVTCESKNNRQKECAMDTRGSVRIVRQLSETRCVEGVNWGRTGNRSGLKTAAVPSLSRVARIRAAYGSSSNLPMRVTCESENNRQRECAMDTRGSVRIVRQLSETRCVEGVNWGRSGQSIWVKNGCRAEFEASGTYSGGYGSSSNLPMRVTCESENNRQKVCAMDTRGSVRIVRQLSDTRCVEGVNWGRSRAIDLG